MGVLNRPLTVESVFDNRCDMTVEINLFDEIFFVLVNNLQMLPVP